MNEENRIDRDVITTDTHCEPKIDNKLSYAMMTIKAFNSQKVQKAIDTLTNVRNSWLSALSPIIKFIRKIDLSSLQEAQKSIKKVLSAAVDYDRLINFCMNILYHNDWFPSPIYVCRVSFFLDLSDIINSTKDGSKNRNIKINELMYSYVDKEKISQIKRTCKESTDIDKCYKKLISEALNAYNDKHYGTTTIVLTMLWQNMISLKVSDRVFQKDDKIIEIAEELITENGEPNIYLDFIKKRIYYSCSSFEEVKKDLPNRHMIAHGWLNDYPSRKAALNAILFTEFLLNLPTTKKE